MGINVVIVVFITAVGTSITFGRGVVSAAMRNSIIGHFSNGKHILALIFMLRPCLRLLLLLLHIITHKGVDKFVVCCFVSFTFQPLLFIKTKFNRFFVILERTYFIALLVILRNFSDLHSTAIDLQLHAFLSFLIVFSTKMSLFLRLVPDHWLLLFFLFSLWHLFFLSIYTHITFSQLISDLLDDGGLSSSNAWVLFLDLLNA